MEPWDALHHVIKLCAISTNVDLTAEDDKSANNHGPSGQGLEFDYVFIASAVDGEFPSYLATNEGRRHEEARIFYVAVTAPSSVASPTRLYTENG